MIKPIQLGNAKITILVHPENSIKTPRWFWCYSTFNASGKWRSSSGIGSKWTREEAEKEAKKERIRLRKLQKEWKKGKK